jgi:hypothetical protein
VWRYSPRVANTQEAIRMNLIFPIWFILAAIFAYLAYMQWRLSAEPLRTFHFRNRGKDDVDEGSSEVNRETIVEFNNYLEMINFRNKKNHQMAAIGFFVAVFLSLVSMFLVVGKF